MPSRKYGETMKTWLGKVSEKRRKVKIDLIGEISLFSGNFASHSQISQNWLTVHHPICGRIFRARKIHKSGTWRISQKKMWNLFLNQLTANVNNTSGQEPRFFLGWLPLKFNFLFFKKKSCCLSPTWLWHNNFAKKFWSV